jgi:RHS repeat-associated protein
MIKRVIDGQVTRYIYNANNRLIRVEDGSGGVIANYYYDPFGRRLWKEVNGERTYFHYSEQGLIGEYDHQGNPIRFYGYKPGSNWTTDPLFLKKDGEYYFYHNDHLGTPQKLTARNGKVVWSSRHASFGRTQVIEQEIKNPLRFPGQYYDEETGLHYNYHRYYESQFGRYLRKDPLGMVANINTYIYARANPIDNYDSTGKQSNKIKPSPAFKKCVKKVKRKYIPKIKKHKREYELCLSKCEKLKKLDNCKSSNKYVNIYIITCKVGCYLELQKEWLPLRIKYISRLNVCWMLYFDQYKYHDTE